MIRDRGALWTGRRESRVGAVLGAAAAGSLYLTVTFMAFDSTYVVVTLGDAELRPHHALIAFGLGCAVLAGLTRGRHLAVGGRRVLVAITVAATGFVIAAWASPLGTAFGQRSVDVLIVFGAAALTIMVCRRDDLLQLLLVVAALGVGLTVVVAQWSFVTEAELVLGDRYRGQVTLLGDERRLTRPFSHANIAAMFLAPAAIGAAAVAAARQGRQRVAFAVLALATAFTATMTASRAAVAAMLIGAVVVIVVFRLRSALAVLAVVSGVLLAYPASPAVRERVGGSDRFAATIVAPADLELSETVTTSVRVRNGSGDIWRADGPDRVRLTARWRDADQTNEWVTQVWPLPDDLDPGDVVDIPIQIPLDVPDGAYVVVWDLLLDREAFFLESRGGQVTSIVQVVGSTSELTGGPVVRARPEPGRRAIWGWALELFADRPVFGHGPGQMRFVVNDVADTDRGVSVSHAHNLALEPLSAGGLVGGLPFVALLGALFVDVARRVRRAGPELAVVGLALVVIFVHGAVEWPLMFPPPAVLLGVLAGAWVAGRTSGVMA